MKSTRLPFGKLIIYHLLLTALLVLEVFLVVTVFNLQINIIKATIISFLFSISGILGEALFSYTFKLATGKGFWRYNFYTIFNRHSSLLNILPWAIGGWMFVSFFYDVKFFLSTTPFIVVFVVFLFMSGVLGFVIEYIFGKLNYILFKKRFWEYNFFIKDNGHISLISPFAFALAGEYFYLLYILAMKFIWF